MADTNKRFYWLKLNGDFFRQKEIKKLRRIAGGDTFTIIYLKMLLRSMEDGGKLYYEGIEDNFVNELALDIDEDSDNVGITVQFLLANGILHQNTISEYEMLTAAEMTGSECESARRVRKLRAARALEIPASLSETALQCNGAVTDCNTEKEKDIEKRKKNISCPRKRAKSEIPVGFTEFWNAYPRKVAKQNALKAWAKTGAEDSQALTDTIIADVRRRLSGEWDGKEVQYIPHPATYLNQRRWEDETSAGEKVEREVERDRPLEEVLHHGEDINPEDFGFTPCGGW